MSKLEEFLEKNIVPFYNKESNTFTPSVQEEYLTSNGWLEKNYLIKKANVHMSTHTYRKLINKVFGATEFERIESTNEVSEEDFLEVYKFGKYPARHWITIFSNKGKVLTREKLFEYMLNYTEPNSTGSYILDTTKYSS